MNIKEIWLKCIRKAKVALIVYIMSFIIATSTHIYDIIKDGFLPYIKCPLWANIYWTSLTFLDPLSIVLLIVNIRIGLILYTFIIISDVIINIYFTVRFQGLYGLINIYMICQSLFLIFLLWTIKSIWINTNHNKK